MMFGKRWTLEDVVESQLCCGCGACAYYAPDRIAGMTDVPDAGRRPVFRDEPGGRASAGDAVAVCPGIGVGHERGSVEAGAIPELLSAWGPVLAVFEGHASDLAVRFAGSSGGAATALALWCLEAGGMHGVLHTAGRRDTPYLNETVMSHSREQLLAAAGSRYAPASPCDGLHRIENAPGPCAFVGKPCDVAAVRMAARLRPALKEKLGVAIAFFCAGTPSTRGTLEMLREMGIDDPDSLLSLRYRGNGWPGKATAVFRGAHGDETRELTYEESWGAVLSRHRQWRCKICADHTGEFADIAVGDPWYRPIEPDEPGRSLILVRTQRGKDVLEAAVAAGYLAVEEASPAVVPASQPNLLKTRGAVWGRILACRLAGTPAPRYRNMPLARHWWRALDRTEKARSIAGTFKRISALRNARVRKKSE